MTTPSLKQKLTVKVHKSLSTLLGIKLAIYSAIIFLIFGFPEFFASIPNFRQRWFGIASLVGYVVVTGIITYLRKWTIRRKISVYLQSNLLLFYSLIFYLRINSPTIDLAGYEFNSAFAFLPLLGLIFLVNRNLFNQNKNQTFLLISQVFLVSISTFSLLSLLETQRTASLEFSRDFLFEFFDQPNIVWIGFSSFVISIISTLNLRLNQYKDVILFSAILTVITSQIMFILNSFNITYWYQTLLFIVFWDFIYHPFDSIIHQEVSTRFYSKFMISLGYHALLFVLILFAFNNPIL